MYKNSRSFFLYCFIHAILTMIFFLKYVKNRVKESCWCLKKNSIIEMMKNPENYECKASRLHDLYGIILIVMPSVY